MIRFRIKELMEERGIKKPKIKPLVQRGISFNIAHKYLNGKKQDIGRRHMEILCSFLRCTPSDLFEWVPDGNEPLDEQHPLHQIKPRKPFKLDDELKKLTPEEIRKKFEVEGKKEVSGE